MELKLIYILEGLSVLGQISSLWAYLKGLFLKEKNREMASHRTQWLFIVASAFQISGFWFLPILSFFSFCVSKPLTDTHIQAIIGIHIGMY